MSGWKASDDPRNGDDPIVRRFGMASEAISLVMACLAPWTYGAVDAWAETALDAGVALLAILGLGIAARSGCWRRMAGVPSVLLAGLVVLALAQAAPLPASLLRVLSPATASLRGGLAPSVPQAVGGDPGPAVAAPSPTLSLDPDATRHAAAQLAAAWVLFQCVLQGHGHPGALRRFGAALAVNAVLLTLFALIQSLAWSGKIYGLRPSPIPEGHLTGGPFVCHNHLAAYLNMGLGMALGTLLDSFQAAPADRSRSGRRVGGPSPFHWATYAAGLIIVGVISSHSRGGLLSMVSSAAATAALLRPKLLRSGAKTKTRANAAAALALMAILAVLFLITMGSTSPFQRLARILDPDSPDVSGRLEAWKGAVAAWWAHPVWGAGLGSFSSATAAFYHRDIGAYYTHAESEYVQLLAEGGLIGLGLGLGALLAIARLGRRALAAAPPPPRALVLGAIFGGLALAIQCLADFPLHVPAIGVVAVILCAHLCRLGLDARGVGRSPDRAPTRLDRAGAVLIGLVMIAASLAALRQSAVLAEAERQITAAGLPLPDTNMPRAVEPLLPRPELERRRDALVRVMRSRPDWAEGYLRLGNTYLGLYTHMASEWLGDAPADPAHPDLRADPLWLHGVLHSATPEHLAEAGGPLAHEPVLLNLVPAARCFLEARRCCPVLALLHARLAELDFLLSEGEPGTVHAERAARLAGGDSQVMALTAQVAFQLHDLDLAARCWKSYFAARDKNWGGIAVAAAAALAPEKILDAVLPAGSAHAVRFADDLGTTPEVRQYREPLLKAALARLPRDPGLSPVERLWVEARLRARLDERDRARVQMREALEREPNREPWREESVRWLLQWGDFREAYRQALIGTQLNPDHPDLRRAMEVAVQGMKRPTPNQGAADD